MKRRTAPRRPPGARLLRIASLVFGRTTSHLFAQTIADLQQEVRDAGTPGLRARARLRGYLAYWKLVAAVLFFRRDAGVDHPSALTLESRGNGGYLFLVLGVSLFAATWPLFGWFVVAVLLAGLFLAIAMHRWNARHPIPRPPSDPMVALSAVVLLAATWPMFGWFTAAAVTVGLVLAVLIRRWNSRHPSRLAPFVSVPSEPKPEINLLPIHVGGDIGGLFFVVGSLVIVLLGLPGLQWFVAAVVAGGVLVARLLFVWRAIQPSAHARATSIRA